MYTQYFNNRLKKLVLFDSTRINKIGKLLQNNFLYLIFTFIAGLIVNDIFPKFDEFKKKNAIFIEIILQILVISIFVFYLRKVVLLVPYIFSKYSNISSDDTDHSSQYSEITIILIVIISTQGQLLKKINYLFNHFNTNSDNKPKNLANIPNEKENVSTSDNNDSLNMIKDQENNENINLNNEDRNLNNEDRNLNSENISREKYEKKIEKGSMGHFLSNLHHNITALDSPSDLHYSSYYLPSNNPNQLNQNRPSNTLEHFGLRDQFSNIQNHFNNSDSNFYHSQNNINSNIENLSIKNPLTSSINNFQNETNNSNISNQANNLQNNYYEQKNNNIEDFITSPLVKKKSIDEYFPRSSNQENNSFSTKISDLKYNVDNTSLKTADYNSLMNTAQSRRF